MNEDELKVPKEEIAKFPEAPEAPPVADDQNKTFTTNSVPNVSVDAEGNVK